MDIKIITIISALCMIFFIGCSNNKAADSIGDCDGVQFGEHTVDELNAVTETGSAYFNDPTPAKCEAYKSALQNYIDVLRDIDISCVPEASRQNYHASIEETEESIASLDCSGS